MDLNVLSPDAQEAKNRRLARNREAARRSRKKKKEYVALMEYKVRKLTEEVGYLRNLKKEREL
jgi:hypothetical protein